MSWNDGITRPVALDGLGQQYRRYRLADPEAEEAMAGSLRRWGQLAPVVACVRQEKLELLDGFKRWSAARQITGMTLSVRVLEVDERAAKAAILGLNRGQRPARGSVDRARFGARRWDDASGGGAFVGPAQELGVPPAGVVGEVERGGERGFAFGPGGTVAGATIDAVAHGQPGSAAGVDTTRDVDGSCVAFSPPRPSPSRSWTNLPTCTRTLSIRACVKNRSVHVRPATTNI